MRRLDARQAMAFPLKELGTVAWKQGDSRQAKKRLNECLAIYRENGDQWGTAGTLDSLGIAACEERDYEKAISAINNPVAEIISAVLLELPHFLETNTRSPDFK